MAMARRCVFVRGLFCLAEPAALCRCEHTRLWLPHTHQTWHPDLVRVARRTSLIKMTACSSSAFIRQTTTLKPTLVRAVCVVCFDGAARPRVCVHGASKPPCLTASRCSALCGAWPAAGALTYTSAGAGAGFTLNVPLPPGSGSGAYRAAFDRVVAPALDAFGPQLVLVSAGVSRGVRGARVDGVAAATRRAVVHRQARRNSTCARGAAQPPAVLCAWLCVAAAPGFDANYMDPLGHMMLGSEDFRYFTAALQVCVSGLLLLWCAGALDRDCCCCCCGCCCCVCVGCDTRVAGNAPLCAHAVTACMGTRCPRPCPRCVTGRSGPPLQRAARGGA
jgi:hypothetical protein